ncbi:MAG: hypothetical protein PUA69_02510 [Erysipelotrichaceae bacterium]|nr:hypothetical protein [Erysipelotrichaceae bacterium]
MHAFKKLHEQSGLSLAIALLIFLACAMAGATILSAATASDGTLLDLKEDSHDTYLLDSAADYIISKAEDVIENTVWTMAQTVSASKQSSDESLDFTITSDDTSEVIHADMSMDKDNNLKIQLTKNRDNHTSYLNVRIAGSAYVDPSGTVKTVSWKDDNPRITRRKV